MRISVDNFRTGVGPREIDVDLSTVPDHILIFFGQSVEARAEHARRTFVEAKDWNPADHPRAPRGTREGGRFVGEITHLVDEAIAGGFSFNPFTHHEPTDGYMVARVDMAVEVPAGSREEAVRGMHEFLAAHRDLFEAEPDLFIGGWVENGTLIIEPSDQVTDRAEAVLLAQARDQIALFDVAGTRTIDTGGSGGARARPGYNVSPTRIFGAKGLLRPARGLLRDERGGADRRAGADPGPAGRGLKFDPDQPRVPGGRTAVSGSATSFPTGAGLGTARFNDWETTMPWRPA